MTAHELANHLLKMPDVTVWGDEVGQGSEEGQDVTLKAALLSMDGEEVCLIFYPLELNRESIEREYGPQ